MSDFLSKQLIKTDKIDITVSEVFIVVFILLTTFIIIKVIKFLLFKINSGGKSDYAHRYAVFQIIKYLAWILAFTLSMDALAIKITLLLAGSAALLVGLGLGLQQIFQDIMSGVAMLIEGSLRIGDVVEVDKDTIGKVKEINLRTSKIETRDNIIMIVPNSRFITETVINWTHINKQTRFFVNVGVAYGSDIELVTKVLLECATSHSLVSKTPKPFVRFLSFGDSSLDFQIFYYSTERFRAENIKSDIRYAINKAFTENKIKIPFPQRDVYINPE